MHHQSAAGVSAASHARGVYCPTLFAALSIQANDFLVVQALVLLGAGAYIALNFIADILYGIVDPRIKAVGR